jgi:hypothetical protein
MASLDGTVIEQYTQGRLVDGDDETERLLSAALGAAQRYCGWHVTPVQTDTVTLDGPNHPVLVLPTLKLVDIASITENELAVDLDFVKWSADGRVRKTFSYPLSTSWFGPYWGSGCFWTGEFQGITVTMEHGFDDAPEWQSAVLSLIDRTSLSVGSGLRESVGPFSFASIPGGVGSVFSDSEKMLLDLYRLERSP